MTQSFVSIYFILFESQKKLLKSFAEILLFLFKYTILSKSYFKIIVIERKLSIDTILFLIPVRTLVMKKPCFKFLNLRYLKL